MKDPFSTLFSIGRLTVWHRDKGGVDGGCIHFMRAHHGDAAVLEKIIADFQFHAKSGVPPWFTATGDPILSTRGIVTCMFFTAAIHTLGTRRKALRYLRKHHFEIMFFAENDSDTMHTSIQGTYGEDSEPMEKRMQSAARVVYAYILRDLRPWWKHLRFHVHHWRFSHPKWNGLFNKLGIGTGSDPSISESASW